MSDKQAYESLLHLFREIENNAILKPGMPMDSYIQEAVDQYAWGMTDKARLVAAGLLAELLDGLPARIAAARYAQSLWRALRFDQAEAREKYAEESPRGYELRDELVHRMLFAYRKLPLVRNRVREIAEGSGDSDMIQDLSDLSVLGKQNLEPLVKLNIDLALLDEAQQLCSSLSNLLAAARGGVADTTIVKKDRDQAYTYLKQAVDEIREFGRYEFWKEPERLQGYASNYLRSKREAAEARAVEKAAQAKAKTNETDTDNQGIA